MVLDECTASFGFWTFSSLVRSGALSINFYDQQRGDTANRQQAPKCSLLYVAIDRANRKNIAQVQQCVLLFGSVSNSASSRIIRGNARQSHLDSASTLVRINKLFTTPSRFDTFSATDRKMPSGQLKLHRPLLRSALVDERIVNLISHAGKPASSS